MKHVLLAIGLLKKSWDRLPACRFLGVLPASEFGFALVSQASSPWRRLAIAGILIAGTTGCSFEYHADKQTAQSQSSEGANSQPERGESSKSMANAVHTSRTPDDKPLDKSLDKPADKATETTGGVSEPNEKTPEKTASESGVERVPGDQGTPSKDSPDDSPRTPAPMSPAAEQGTGGRPAEGEQKPNGAEGTTAGNTGAPKTAPKRDLLQIESTSRGRTRENGVELITFDDLNLGMQADMVFRDFLLTDRARELDGQRVRIVGYMDGGVSQQKGIKEFVLLKNTECKFGAGGQADHLVRVLLQDDVTVDYTRFGALQIEGVLKVSPFNGPDGNTWSVYDLLGHQVKTIKKK